MPRVSRAIYRFLSICELAHPLGKSEPALRACTNHCNRASCMLPVAPLLVLARTPPCGSRGHLPTLCESNPPFWTMDELKRAVPDFTRVFLQIRRAQRERIGRNAGGMQLNHAFAMWFTVRALRPPVVIESGVYHGQGTALIRDAAGPATRIFSFDPRSTLLDGAMLDQPGQDSGVQLVHRDPNATYFIGGGAGGSDDRLHAFMDLTSADWDRMVPSAAERAQALLVVDDHMSAIKRVQQLLKLGFRHIWYDDNWARGQHDCYSFNVMCAPLVSSQLGRQGRLLYMDEFARQSIRITRAEHEANLAFLQSQLEVYFEFPPLAEPCTADSGNPGREAVMTTAEARSLFELTPKEMSLAASVYPPYVRLRGRGALDPALLFKTTPYLQNRTLETLPSLADVRDASRGRQLGTARPDEGDRLGLAAFRTNRPPAPKDPATCRVFRELFDPNPQGDARGAARLVKKMHPEWIARKESVYPSRQELYDALYAGTDPYANVADRGRKWERQMTRSFVSAAHVKAHRITALIETLLDGPVRFLVEVGSYIGTSATKVWGPIAEKAGGLVLCVDSWESSAEGRLSGADGKLAPLEHGQPRTIETFLSRVVANNLTRVIHPLAMPSIEASRVFGLMRWKVDVVYIDSAHERGSTHVELHLYYLLLRPGGIMLGDDYNTLGVSVFKEVDRFVACHGLRLGFISGKTLVWYVQKPL